MSLPLRGEWIEIVRFIVHVNINKSLPLRGEWIEIRCHRTARCNHAGLSLCGESGLKSIILACYGLRRSGLSLCGESGLKSWKRAQSDWGDEVSPFAGRVDWNGVDMKSEPKPYKSLPLRGEWIEIIYVLLKLKAHSSLPLRGEWIEIGMC